MRALRCVAALCWLKCGRWSPDDFGIRELVFLPAATSGRYDDLSILSSTSWRKLLRVAGASFKSLTIPARLAHSACRERKRVRLRVPRKKADSLNRGPALTTSLTATVLNTSPYEAWMNPTRIAGDASCIAALAAKGAVCSPLTAHQKLTIQAASATVSTPRLRSTTEACCP